VEGEVTATIRLGWGVRESWPPDACVRHGRGGSPSRDEARRSWPAAGPAEQPAGRHDVRDHFDGEGGHDKLVDATGSGLRELVRRLRRAHVQEVVISPNQVHSLRGRYGSAGNKDDRFDAFVLADTLRTDRARLRPLIPDSLTGHRAARGVAAEEPDRWVSRSLRASPGQTGEAATSIGHAPATTGAAQRHDHDLRLEY
jgi:Transposase.